MKEFFKKILIVLEEMGKARAAAQLASTGHYRQAQDLLTKDAK